MNILLSQRVNGDFFSTKQSQSTNPKRQVTYSFVTDEDMRASFDIDLNCTRNRFADNKSTNRMVRFFCHDIKKSEISSVNT